MFTVKFMNHYADGTCRESVVCCVHYEIYRRMGVDPVTTVTTYKDATVRSGVDRHVSPHPEDYDVCFIENSAGKTIDTIRPDGQVGRYTSAG